MDGYTDGQMGGWGGWIDGQFGQMGLKVCTRWMHKQKKKIAPLRLTRFFRLIRLR